MPSGRRPKTAADMEAAAVIGAALRAMRLRAGLSYRDMREAGIPRSTAYNLERGTRVACFLLVARWVRACGCSLAVLEDELERYARTRRQLAACGAMPRRKESAA